MCTHTPHARAYLCIWAESSPLAAASHDSFAHAYQEYLSSSRETMSDEDRFRWLTCMDYYLSWHHEVGGKPEWTAMVDHRLSRVMYPIDIDKVTGIDPKSQGKAPVPVHFKFSDHEASDLQKQLLSEFGVLAINHTDEHSPFVLKELLFLLRNGIGKKLTRGLPSLHYLFAFSGHDPKKEIAAFHYQMKAISVGGMSSYPAGTDSANLSAESRMDLLLALAHEIGHAFIFDHVSPRELIQVARDFGHWNLPSSDPAPKTLYDEVFFQPMSKPSRSIENLTTEYAANNIHEWFAEAFAAKVLLDLGEAGRLGNNWRPTLIKSHDRDTYWTDYNKLAPNFRNWLQRKIRSI